MDGGLAADHADGGELGDFVGERHEVGDGAEGLVGEGGVEAGEEDALAEGDELERERDDVGSRELDLVDADDVDFVELRSKSSARSSSTVAMTTALVGLRAECEAMAVRW